MKNLFTLITLLTIVGTQAQWKVNFDKEDKFTEQDQKKISWGYFVGVNTYDYKIHPKYDYGTQSNTETGGTAGTNSNGTFLITSEPKMGFSAGLMAKLRVNRYVDIWVQPGLNFTERTLRFQNIRPGNTYTAEVYDPDTGTTVTESYTAVDSDTIRTVKSTYLDVPFFVQLHGNRWFNTRPYIQAGVGYSMNLQSNEDSDDDNLDGIFRTTKHNFNWQVEAGINIYFKRFKLTPSVKGIFFFNNELVPDDSGTPAIWAGALTSLKSRAILFSLKFE